MSEKKYILKPGGHHTHHGSSYGSAGTSPSAAGFLMRHEVQAQDTLQSIAVHHNVTVSDIERANKMMPGESIHSRKHLVIPVSEKPRHGPSSHGPATIATTNTEVAAAATGPTSPQRERAAAPKTAQDFLSQFDAKFSQTKSSVDKVLSTRPLPASNPTSPRTSPSSSRRTTTLESIHATTLPPPTIGAAAAAQRSVRARPAWVEPALEVDSNNTLSNDDMFEL